MSTLNVTKRVSTVLACVALDRQLSGVLLLDLDPVLLFPLATWLAELIGGPVPDGQPPVLDLGGRHTEEVLWGRFVLTTDRAEPLHWVPGMLDGHARRPGIVMVPDLARLSLPAARAAVALVGADVAHLESSRQSGTWHPRDRWLATLHRQDVGTVSPHLLDRFSVRVDAAGLESQLRGRESRRWYPPTHLASAVTWRWLAWPGPWPGWQANPRRSPVTSTGPPHTSASGQLPTRRPRPTETLPPVRMR